MDLICLGELLIDMFPAELGRSHAEVSAFRPVPGGAPANVAVAAARLGAAVAFIGKVGADPFGYHLRDVLAAEGVVTRGMCFDSQARTTMNLLAQPDPDHYDCFFYRNPGADSRLTAAELDRDLLASARVLHFGSLSLSEEPIRAATWEAVRVARSAGARPGALISFDVNYRPTLWRSAAEALAQVEAMIPYVDLLKVNEGELALLAGADAIEPEGFEPHAADLVARGPRLVVVTFGPRGSGFRTREGGGFVPAFRVPTADATGCGDAFIAGLLWQLVGAGRSADDLSAARLAAALRYANAVGALTAQKVGVIPALPAAAEVEEFLQEHS